MFADRGIRYLFQTAEDVRRAEATSRVAHPA